MVKWIETEQNLTFIIDGTTVVFRKDDPSYTIAKHAIENGNIFELKRLKNPTLQKAKDILLGLGNNNKGEK